ncbi:MAG: hypothetical protein RSP_00780 [Rhodanobacter sp.]
MDTDVAAVYQFREDHVGLRDDHRNLAARKVYAERVQVNLYHRNHPIPLPLLLLLQF